MFEIDEFDEKILKIVRRNNRTPAEKIAGQVGLSTSAVQRRLKRLRKEKIIRADVSIVASEIDGPAITAVVGVTLEQENPAILNDFRKKLRAAPEVIQSYYVTGEVDLILIVRVRDMPAFEKFAHALLTADQYVKRYNTNIVISEIKSGFDFPLE